MRAQWCRKRGCRRTHKSFDLVKFLAKSVEIRAKMAPKMLWFENNGAQNRMKISFGGNPKYGLIRKFSHKKWPKHLSGKCGEIQAKIIHSCSSAYVRPPGLIHLWGSSPTVTMEKWKSTKPKMTILTLWKYGQQIICKPLVECPTITELVATFDAKAFNDAESCKEWLVGGKARTSGPL